MSRLLPLVLFHSIFASAGACSAQEPHEQVWKYLQGQWAYEVTDGRKGIVTYQMAAKGNAVIARFEEEDGTVAVEISGWQADKKTVIVTGYNSKGSYWQIEYATISSEKGEGLIRGVGDDGGKYSGEFVDKKVDENHWEWRLDGKTAASQEFDLLCKLTRKAARPRTPELQDGGQGAR